KAAEAELAKVLELFEQKRAEIIEEGNRDQFFDISQDTYDIAVDFAYSREQNASLAFQYAENSRARSLSETMRTGARVSMDADQPDLQLEAKTTSSSIEDIRQTVPDQVQLLAYAVLDEKVLIWVVTKSKLKA